MMLKKTNELVVAFNLWNNAKRNRKYPKLSLNDDVRVSLKKEVGKTKGYFPKWSKQVYKIIGKDGNDFLINDGKRKVHIRSELLKV